MSDSSPPPEAGAVDAELRSSTIPGPVEWLLLTGDRLTVTVGLLLAIFAVFGTLLLADVVAVADSDVLTRSLVALVTGNLTLITIVISINQLILSREFGTPDELHARIQNTMDYRQEVADLAEVDVSPTTPVEFLDFLVKILREETASLRETGLEAVDEAGRSELEAFTDALIDQAEEISGTLEGRTQTPFEPLQVVLGADFTAGLYTARRIQTSYDDSLPSTARTSLDRLIRTFEHVGVARQYLRTLYFERELAGLSRKILLVGVPALVLLLATTWTYGGEATPTVPRPVLGWLVVVTGTVGFAPLAVFFSYVLRIATITRRTPSLVPFEIRNDDPL